jgi:hypothetical protein
MADKAQQYLKQCELQNKQTEKKKVGGYVILKEELTLQNVIKTKEQADFFMKMLKALSK